MKEPERPPTYPKALLWAGFVVSWIIPGGGFMVFGRWARGLANFTLITLTFVLGLALHGSVTWPSWSTRDENFNLINNLTLIVQLGSGLPAFFSLMATQAGDSVKGVVSWLAGQQNHPCYELGSYYLIVAGALNYFAIGNFYDRLINTRKRFLAEGKLEGKG
jgi:hypothetical protein